METVQKMTQKQNQLCKKKLYRKLLCEKSSSKIKKHYGNKPCRNPPAMPYTINRVKSDKVNRSFRQRFFKNYTVVYSGYTSRQYRFKGLSRQDIQREIKWTVWKPWYCTVSYNPNSEFIPVVLHIQERNRLQHPPRRQDRSTEVNRTVGFFCCKACGGM